MTTRIAVGAAAVGVLVAGVQMWMAPSAAAGAATPPRSFAEAYNQPTFYGPGRVPVATAPLSVAPYQLQRIQMGTKDRTDIFSVTITGSNSAGLPRYPLDRTITPELELVEDPALAAASAADTCGNNCTFNLTQTSSGWVLNEFVDGGLVGPAGPVTVTVDGDVVSIAVDISTLTPVAQKVLGDPRTDVQAGFMTQAADGSGEENVSNPYAIGSLVGLGSGSQVIGPWQGRLLGPQALSATPCSGNIPLWFTYTPSVHLENVVFSQPVTPGITVEGGGPASSARNAVFNTLVVQTSGTPKGGIGVSSIDVETNNQPLVPLPVIPANATVSDNVVSLTLADENGNPLVQTGGYVTAAVSIRQSSGTCVYHFPIVALSLFPVPKAAVVTTAVSSSFWLGGSAGIAVIAALLGMAAAIAVLVSRFHARAARERSARSEP
ncbi:MAG TPA: hypothetical protein VG412_03430 [Acidimicrobiales bacterium]|nr:hypothetical protein [Acidimicrobiales bacterium]